jgi:hypothetical protein
MSKKNKKVKVVDKKETCGGQCEHDEIMIAIGYLPEGDGGEHAEIMREIMGYDE